MKTVGATEIKNRLGRYIEMAMREPIFIEKTNRRVAVLLSAEEYDRLTRLEDVYWGEKAKAAEAEGYLSEVEKNEFLEASQRVKA